MAKLSISIAGIDYKIRIPNNTIGDEYISFLYKGVNKPDVWIRIKPKKVIPEVSGKLIYDNELEWYCTGSTEKKYIIVMRDDKSSRLVVKMETDMYWSDIIIKYNPNYPDIRFILHILLVEIAFRNRIISHNGLVVHASAILHNNECIMFSAPSGTGKSTQARLWEEHMGAVVINDDHPAVKLIDNKPVVFGTPWAGSDRKYQNINAPLRAVFILEQSNEIMLRKLDFNDIINCFLPRCFLPYYDEKLMVTAMQLFESMFLQIPVYLLKCTPDKESVYIVLNELYPDKPL